MVRALLAIVLGIAFAIVSVMGFGALQWRRGTDRLRARLEDARSPVTPTTYDPRELDSLPNPVQRYFRAVLTPGQPMVTAVRLAHRGTFNMSDTSERWVPFSSDQRVVTRRPGFDWDARIAMMPSLTGWVHDAYAAGEGMLHATLFGLIPIVRVRGTPEVAQGELMRFLAEAAWYPTALLPSQGVRWERVDEHSARATLTDGDIAVSLTFRFGPDGLIETIRSEERPRVVAGRIVPTPWLGRWSDWDTRDGMRIPLEGEVAWLLPAGPLPYWRGRITRIRYEVMR